MRTRVVPLLDARSRSARDRGPVASGSGARTKSIIEDALAIDDLTLRADARSSAPPGSAPCCSRGAAPPPREAGDGDYYALLLRACLGMVRAGGRENLVTLFIGFELLSIPLYVMCATEMRREHSLESGLKYLIIGSVGSATLLYGLALIYGATGVDRLPGDRRRRSTTSPATRCC